MIRGQLAARWLATMLAVCAAAAGNAQADIDWRVTVKVFVRRQADTVGPDADVIRQRIDGWIDHANAIHDKYGRGYRFHRTETLFLVEPDWADALPNATSRLELDQDTAADSSRFLLRNNAINIYVSTPTEPKPDDGFNGYCARPALSDDHVILIRHDAGNGTLVHEVGHYMNLCHTHGCGCGHCGDDNCPDSDEVGDTIRDSACWGTADEITVANFAVFGFIYYEDLPVGWKEQVNNVLHNVMSYHSDKDIFTPGQLDRMTDASNNQRRQVASGQTWFVDATTDCLLADGSSSCSLPFDPLGPFKVVSDGVNAAEAGDVVLIRKSRYPGPLTISKKVILRASGGCVELGAP